MLITNIYTYIIKLYIMEIRVPSLVTGLAAEEMLKVISHQGDFSELFYLTPASPFTEGDIDDLKRLAAFLGVRTIFPD